MGGGGRGLMDPEKIDGLSYLEDGQFAKVYKGHMFDSAQGNQTKQIVSIKVPRVPDAIRKDKRRLLLLSISFSCNRGLHPYLVCYVPYRCEY